MAYLILCIITGNHYVSYKNSLKTLGLDDLEARRKQLCLNFFEEHQAQTLVEIK